MSNCEPVDLTVSKTRPKPKMFRPYEDLEPVSPTEIEQVTDDSEKMSKFKINSSSSHTQPSSFEGTPMCRYIVPPSFYSNCQFLFPYQWYQRRLSRPLCGKYVKSGPAASRLTLLILRQRILQRQQMKLFLHSLQQNDGSAKTATYIPQTNSQPFYVR